MFTESIFNKDDWHTPRFQFDSKLGKPEIEMIDGARTNYLEIHGNCKIPVPFRCEIGDVSITCEGQYARKPPMPPRKSNMIFIDAKFEGSGRHETDREGSSPEFKSGYCKVVEFPSKNCRTLAINSQDILLDVHRLTYQRVFYTLAVREEYGADDKLTYVLLKVGNPVDVGRSADIDLSSLS